jgi:hypothetical protein
VPIFAFPCDLLDTLESSTSARCRCNSPCKRSQRNCPSDCETEMFVGAEAEISPSRENPGSVLELRSAARARRAKAFLCSERMS